MATLQEIQADRHKWEVDPTRSTRAPGGTRYRLKEKYKKEQRKKSKEAPKRASMKERLSAATATKKVSDTPKKSYGASKTGKTKIKSTDFVPFKQRTRASKALAGRKAPSAATVHPRRAEPPKPPKELPALPNEVPESERQRILPALDDERYNIYSMSKAGGKVAKSKGGTVKKRRGGTLQKKKNNEIYDNHDGGLLVASLYDELGD
tara:strand:- start:31 stop:651 length:621 start_codon:yes stop_codon:yes gene_type:complete